MSEFDILEYDLPPVEETLDLLDAAYDGWYGKEVFDWKYRYPDTARDEHHIHIRTDSRLTAFTRLYHRTLHVGTAEYPVIVRGNSAVHPEYQGQGQYRVLHEANERYGESSNTVAIMTFNRKDKPSFQTSAKSDWEVTELPLYISILSPDTALKQYAASILGNHRKVEQLLSLCGDRIRIDVDGNSISVSELVGGSAKNKHGMTIPLSKSDLNTLVRLSANDEGMQKTAQELLHLLTRENCTHSPTVSRAETASRMGAVDVIPRGLHTSDDVDQFEALYRSREHEETVRFRREARDIDHMLRHPNLVGTLVLEEDGELVGFAPVYATRSGEAIEGRVADLVCANNEVWEQMVDAVHTFCRNAGIDVIAMLSQARPGEDWIRIRCHVLTWDRITDTGPDIASKRFDLGFYDVV